MSPALRMIVVLAAAIPVTLFVAIAPFLIFGWKATDLVQFVIGALSGVGIGWLVWSRTSADSDPGGLAATILIGAFVTGGVGFLLGFFGPMLILPGANQGPLLGVLVTGPGGFIIGAVGGYVYWIRRTSQRR